MAKHQDVARKHSSHRDEAREPGRDTAGNGRDGDVAGYEQELAGYLQTRIKPGLNRGSIPLLARSIAKEIARQEYSNGAAGDAEDDDELIADEDDELSAEDEPGTEDDDETEPDLEAALHELQTELGEDWILYFSVQGDDTWLTAEKDDASQRVEAPNAKVLTRAVKVLNEGGGRRRTRAR